MSHFYTNITLAGPEQRRVVEVLRRLQWHAYVSQTTDGVTTVFEFASESGQVDVITELAADLSAAFECAALAAVHGDDGVLNLWLYERGLRSFRYSSSPSYFWGEHLPPTAGDAETLCAAFGAGVARRRVEKVLTYDKLDPANAGSGRYVSEVERHADLLAALGLPGLAAGAGFCRIRDDDLPPDFDKAGLAATWVGAPWAKLDRHGAVLPGV